MRVLFLHAAWDGLTSEYKVHTTLAAHAPRDGLDPFFIWQAPVRPDQVPVSPERLIQHDFGRNMSLTPRPGRLRRAGLMIRRLPHSLLFLYRQAKKLQPDLLYTSQQAFDVRLAAIISRLLGLPHLIHIHYFVGPWLGRHALKRIRNGRYLLAVSEFVRQTAMLQGATAANIHTIVNPAPPLSPPSVETAAIRAEFNISPTAPLIAAVGRLDPMKGHLDLLEAFARLRPQSPDCKLLICGASTSRDDYADLLRRRAAALALNDSVIFAGQRSDIAAILPAATLFCLPTQLEPFGLVFLEAMTAGLPVVAYRSGGVPEIVSHNKTGLLSYPNDIDALAANLLRIIREPAYGRQLGAAGRERALTEFAPADIAAHWLARLRQLDLS